MSGQNDCGSTLICILQIRNIDPLGIQFITLRRDDLFRNKSDGIPSIFNGFGKCQRSYILQRSSGDLK